MWAMKIDMNLTKRYAYQISKKVNIKVNKIENVFGYMWQRQQNV